MGEIYRALPESRFCGLKKYFLKKNKKEFRVLCSKKVEKEIDFSSRVLYNLFLLKKGRGELLCCFVK